MQALLGALLVKMERDEEAEATLRAVIDAAPSFAKPAEDLGFLLLRLNRPADALPMLERATRLDPSLERAWFSLGKALALLGRGKEADAAFEKSFELSPERRLMAHAAEHQKEGRIEEAERIYRRVLQKNPRNVDALRLLALLAMRADRQDDAELLLQRAIEVAPDFLLALLDLGRLRKEQDRYEEALECFDRVIALEPSQPQAHFLRAATLARASFTMESIDAYRKCLSVRPGHVGALLGLGHVLKAMGDYDGAVASYRECIQEAPDFGETYWSLANLKTYRFDDAMVSVMEKRAAVPGANAQAAVNFSFAVGKAF
jgi:tetratricopeptide (TPR) repeat protein